MPHFIILKHYVFLELYIFLLIKIFVFGYSNWVIYDWLYCGQQGWR